MSEFNDIYYEIIKNYCLNEYGEIEDVSKLPKSEEPKILVVRDNDDQISQMVIIWYDSKLKVCKSKWLFGLPESEEIRETEHEVSFLNSLSQLIEKMYEVTKQKHIVFNMKSYDYKLSGCSEVSKEEWEASDKRCLEFRVYLNLLGYDTSVSKCKV